MEPIRNTSLFVVGTLDYPYLAEDLEVEGTPTLDKIVTAFEKYLQMQAERNLGQKLTAKIPRALKPEFDGTLITTDEELQNRHSQAKSYGRIAEHYLIPVIERHLFKKDGFENWFYGTFNIHFEFDHLPQKEFRNTVILQREQKATVTLTNTGFTAWPSDLKFRTALIKQSCIVESAEYDLVTPDPIPPRGQWQFPFNFNVTATTGDLYFKLRLFTHEGKKFGGRILSNFFVSTRENFEKRTRLDLDEFSPRQSLPSVKRIPPAITTVVGKTVVTNQEEAAASNALHLQLQHDESLFKSDRPSNRDLEGFGLSSKAACTPFENDFLYTDISAIFYPTTLITKSFSFTNNGTMEWEPGLQLSYRFEHPSSHRKMGEGVHFIDLGEKGLDRKGVINDTFEFITPEEPGPYFMFLKLVTNYGIEFGEEIRLQFHVIVTPTYEEIMAFSNDEEKLTYLVRFGFDQADAIRALSENKGNPLLGLAVLFDERELKKANS